MRWAWIALVLVSSSAAQPKIVPRSPVKDPATVKNAEERVLVESPEGQLLLCINDIVTSLENRTLQISDLPFTRYLSFFTVPADRQQAKAQGFEVDRAEFRTSFTIELNRVSGAKSIVPMLDVPGSNGTLVRINIKDAPNWTRTGWEVVGNLDYLFREPKLPHRETEFLRLMTGVKQDPKTLAAVSLLNAYQLFRNLGETRRLDPKGVVAPYYDLLYAAERHPDAGTVFLNVPRPVDVGPEPVKPGKPWPGGYWPPGSKAGDPGAVFYKAGEFNHCTPEEQAKYEKEIAAWKEAKAKAGTVNSIIPEAAKSAGGIKNFPEKGVDFERRWDVLIKAADIDTLLIDPRFGEIARGSKSDAKGGSIVAEQDRFMFVVGSRFGGFGARTFDSRENTGDNDQLERLRDIIKGKIKSDAGELLATMPNGAQACMLVDGEDSRVEVAATDVANNHIGPKLDKWPDVRNPGSCNVCHGATYGFIDFTGAIKDSLRKGLQGKGNDREAERKVRDLIDRWQEETAGYQNRYKSFLKSCTVTAANPAGWTAAQAVKAWQNARDWYDLPVTTAVVAAEFGYTKRDFQNQLLDLSAKIRKRSEDGGKEQLEKQLSAAFGKTIVIESILTRINQLATDQPIPRRTYEVDTAFALMLIFDALREQDEPIKRLVADKILDDALNQLKKRGSK